jgi:hypothetical protein
MFELGTKYCVLCNSRFFNWEWYKLFILGFKFRASCLLGRCSTTWAMPPALSCFSYFWIGSCCQPRTIILLFTAFHVAGITDTHHRAQLICLDGVSLIIFPDWPWTAVLLISTSCSWHYRCEPLCLATSSFNWSLFSQLVELNGILLASENHPADSHSRGDAHSQSDSFEGPHPNQDSYVYSQTFWASVLITVLM